MSGALQVKNLHVRFRRPEGVIHAVNGVSFEVASGEWLGILGESGSGKSVTMLALLGLQSESAFVAQGEALFGDRDLLKLSERKLQSVRGREIGMIFQSLSAGLNPYIRIGDQVMEPMLQHALCRKPEARRRALALLSEVGLADPETQFRRYPFELSGGMRQRVMTAVALACQPQLLIADEPTTALDTTIAIQVLRMLRDICEKRQMTTVMVTHDLGVATNVCDRIIVMYGGMVMETADVDAFVARAAHPYTRGLKEALVDHRDRGRPLRPIPGAAETLWEAPRGCPFAPRCSLADERCDREIPNLIALGEGHEAACHRLEEGMSDVG
ncbi:MAG: ABC transporter ATP-binding protein [Firmicutes bacterium]|nr:ABC transporter ATP-binding protein [Bacillota bacterium]